MKRLCLMVIVALAIVAVALSIACAVEEATPTPSPGATATPEPPPSSEPTPAATPSATPVVPGMGGTVESHSLRVTFGHALFCRDKEGGTLYVHLSMVNTGQARLRNPVVYVVSDGGEMNTWNLGRSIYPKETWADWVPLTFLLTRGFPTDIPLPLVVLAEDPGGQVSLAEFRLPAMDTLLECPY